MRDPAIDGWGFVADVPGHELSITTNNPQQWHVGGTLRTSTHVVLACTCGYQVSFTVTKADKGSSWALKGWKNHVESATADPSEMLFIGNAISARQERSYYVAPSTFLGLSAYIAGSGERIRLWLQNPSFLTRPGWLVLSKTVTKTGKESCSVDYAWAPSRDKAVESAQTLLQRAENRGSKVEWAAAPATKHTVEPATVVVTFSPADLAERIIAATNSNDLSRMMATLDEVRELVSAMPVLTRLAEQLRDRIDHVPPMERLGYEARRARLAY